MTPRCESHADEHHATDDLPMEVSPRQQEFLPFLTFTSALPLPGGGADTGRRPSVESDSVGVRAGHLRRYAIGNGGRQIPSRRTGDRTNLLV